MAKQKSTFEDVLEALGVPGKFQICQILLLLCGKTIASLTIISFVFIGYEPPHVCNAVNETHLLSDYGILNDTTADIVYESCHISLYTNTTGQVKTVDRITCPNGRNFFDAKDTTLLSEWDLVCESRGLAEWTQTTLSLGIAIGGLFCSALADHFGRRPIILIALVLVFLLEATVPFAPNIYMILVIKLFVGFSQQGFMSTFFVLGMEMVVPRHRQKYGVIVCVVWVFHCLLLAGIAYGFRNASWRYFQGVFSLTGLFCWVLPFFLKESPRWLAANYRKEEMLDVLKYASKCNGKSFDAVKEKVNDFWEDGNSADEMKLNGENEELQASNGQEDIITVTKDRRSILMLLRNRYLRVMTFLLLFIWTTHNLTYYGLFMNSSDISGNRFLNFALMALVEIPSNFVILVMMTKMKRKKVLIIFIGMAATSLMTITLFLTFAQKSTTTDVITNILFIFGKFAIGSSFNVLYIMTPEMYPTNVRSIGYGINQSGSKIGAMLAPFARPLFAVASWAPGLIFSVMCIVSLVMVLFLPETKDTDLPTDADDVLRQRKTSPKVTSTDKENEFLNHKQISV